MQKEERANSVVHARKEESDELGRKGMERKGCRR
jgi:hypothetical protein